MLNAAIRRTGQRYFEVAMWWSAYCTTPGLTPFDRAAESAETAAQYNLRPESWYMFGAEASQESGAPHAPTVN